MNDIDFLKRELLWAINVIQEDNDEYPIESEESDKRSERIFKIKRWLEEHP